MSRSTVAGIIVTLTLAAADNAEIKTQEVEYQHGGVKLQGFLAHDAAARNIRGKVLVCHGPDDPFVPPEQVQAFEQEMRGAKTDWQLISYGGAIHSFTNPDIDRLGLKRAAYDRNADRR